MMKLKRMFTGLGLSLGLLVSSAQAASTTYYFSGATCNRVYSDYDLITTTDGGIYSNDDVKTGLICPLNGIKLGSIKNTVTIRAYDRSQAEDLQCTLRDSNGTVLMSSSILHSSGYASSAQSFSGSITSAFVYTGTLHLVCDVPKKDPTLGATGVNYYKWVSESP